MPRLLTSHAAQRYGTRSVKPLELFGLVILSLTAMVWGLTLIGGHPNLQVQEYMLLLGLYGVASAMFVIPRVRANSTRLFDLPVFMTLVAFFRFGLIPLYFFFHPELRLRGYLKEPGLFTQALFYFVLGMIAFWVGSALVPLVGETREETGNREPRIPAINGVVEDDKVLRWAVRIYLVIIAVRMYLLHNHLYSYTTESWDLYYQNIASLQVANVIHQFGPFVMVITAVEAYFHPYDLRRKTLFYVLFASECLWGLISGMKTTFLQGFVMVGVVRCLAERRVRARWLVTPVVLLVLIYPLHNQYRLLLKGKGMQVSTLAEAGKVGWLAITNTLDQTQSMGDWFGGGSDSSLARLDLLQSVAAIVHLGNATDSIRTRDHWWMLPIYLFIPRLIWPSKPVQNMGGDFSVVLGEDPHTASSPTYAGDAYLEFGLPGIIVCMLVLGIFTQWLTRFGTCTLSKRRLFVFASMFLIAVDMDDDVFGYWTGVLKYLVMISLVGWFIYRPPRRSPRLFFRPTASSSHQSSA